MVINVNPNQGVALPAGAIQGLMHVYCVSAVATFGIAIVNAPPPYVWHQLNAGHMLDFQVDGYPVWVYNNGPSRIQLLDPSQAFEGKSIDEVEGALLIDQAGRRPAHEQFQTSSDASPETGAPAMKAAEKLARSEASELAMWLTPFDASRSLVAPKSRALGDDESVDQAVGNDFASDGSALPDLGPLAKLGSWPNVAAVLDRKAMSISGFNPASTNFNETSWEGYLYKFSTLPFFTTISKTDRNVSITELSLKGVIGAIFDLVENIVAGPQIETIVTSVKKIAELAMTNKERAQKDNYQKQGLISIKDSMLTLAFLRCSVEMRYQEGKGYQQLTQTINIFQFSGRLDFEKCKRAANQILGWDQTDVDSWEANTGSSNLVPNSCPAWNK